MGACEMQIHGAREGAAPDPRQRASVPSLSVRRPTAGTPRYHPRCRVLRVGCIACVARGRRVVEAAAGADVRGAARRVRGVWLCDDVGGLQGDVAHVSPEHGVPHGPPGVGHVRFDAVVARLDRESQATAPSGRSTSTIQKRNHRQLTRGVRRPCAPERGGVVPFNPPLVFGAERGPQACERGPVGAAVKRSCVVVFEDDGQYCRRV